VEGLIGRFEHSLDSKGRLVLPARFRPYFDETGGYLAPGLLGAIELFPMEAYEAKKLKLRAKVDEDDDDLKAHRKYLNFTSADKVTLDAQNRIPINKDLQKYGQLAPGSKVVVVGGDVTVHIWHPDVWESEIALPGEDDLHRPRPHTEDS
jgi:MraZ protein